MLSRVAVRRNMVSRVMTRMYRLWIVLGAAYGAAAVGMAAASAHALAGAPPATLRIVDSGVQMQGWHALALLGCGLWAERRGGLAHWAGAAFAAGTLAFCGGGVCGRVGRGVARAGGAGRRAAADRGLAAPRRLRRDHAQRRCAVIRSAYLAADGFEQPLAEELARAGVGVSTWHGRLAISPDPPHPAAWAMDVWTAPAEYPAPSVKARPPQRCGRSSATGPATPPGTTAAPP